MISVGGGVLAGFAGTLAVPRPAFSNHSGKIRQPPPLGVLKFDCVYPYLISYIVFEGRGWGKGGKRMGKEDWWMGGEGGGGGGGVWGNPLTSKPRMYAYLPLTIHYLLT